MNMKKCKRMVKENAVSHIVMICAIPVLIIACLLSVLSMSARQQAYASSLSSKCLAESGASSVESVQNLCTDICPGAVNNKRYNTFGTMWFNDSPTNKNSDVINAQDLTNENMTIYLWGQIYNCGGGESGKQKGLYIWFAEEGQMIGNTVGSNNSMPHKVDFIKNNDATATLSRGGPCSDNPKDCPGYYWFTPTDNRIPITLDVPAFVDYAKQKNKCEGADDNNIKCTVKVSVNRCYSDKNKGYLNTTNESGTTTCYGDDSTITIITGNPPDKPDEPTESTVKGVFTSQSFGKVEINDSILGKEVQSPVSAIDGMLENYDAAVGSIDDHQGGAGLAITSVDINQSSIDLEFWHKLYYNLDPADFNFGEKDVVPSVSTNWTIKTEVKTSGKRTKDNKHPADNPWENISTENGTYKVENSKKSATSTDLATDPHSKVTVELEKGRTTLVCSTIEYKPKTVYFSVKEGGDHDGEYGHATDHLYYEYESKDGTDSGASQTCIAIYRPTEPEGTPWSGAEGGGDTSSLPMYAGERTTIGWNVWAEGSKTNRLTSFQAANYVMPPNANKDHESLKGKYGVLNNPSGGGKVDTKICDFYAAVRSPLSTACEKSIPYPTESEVWDEYVWHELNASVDIVAPNEVGRKHANTAGYFYEVYRCVPNPPPGHGCTWTHFDKKDYWYIYNTAARTIAKKPSVAFWNGGLFTSGDVSTLLAGRYPIGENAVYVAEANAGNKTFFGSWSEYLATVGGNINATDTGAGGLTSGTVLSGGLATNIASFNIAEQSPLTISNRDASAIGHSGLTNDMILRQRLQNYFFQGNQQLSGVTFKESSGDTSSSSLGLGKDMSGTTIISVKSGKLTIDGDITIDETGHDSIYTLPQVIIFAKDGIDILSNVKQIDAWLITDGMLDTCKDFISGTPGAGTEAKIDEYSGNNECSNSLVINGPAIANKVKLNRSYGADGISNEDKDLVDQSSDSRAATAEVFNLSMDSYLWAYAQSGRYSSSYSEVYSRELPPRY